MYIFIFFISLFVLSWVLDKFQKASLYKKLKPKLDNLEQYKQQLDQRAAEQDAREEALEAQREAVILLAKQKSVGFPWLADAYAEYFNLEELKVAQALEQKKYPAYRAAEEVREAAKRRRAAEQRARIHEYIVKYYESLFPWLEDFKSEDIDEALIRVQPRTVGAGEYEDEAQRWLTPEEYHRLSRSEKYELALERYWTKKKTKWELGRDYERYIGYLYEKEGYLVEYRGIIEGFDDLGRDLIAKRGHVTEVVQCKYWSKEKTIHEKHLFQLYGSLITYCYDHKSEEVRATFVTSASLSERAKGFADLLRIEVRENVPLVRYPCVKCNISQQTGEKIYHLPFDQQYDHTVINTKRGELYVRTVAEAEALGFRRAFRYLGQLKA